MNNTGQDACGFEIEVGGVPHGHTTGDFGAQRHGAPAVVDCNSTAGITGRRVTLITENRLVVPMRAAQLESNWEPMPAGPPGEGGRRRGKGQRQKGSTLDPTTRTVVRRFETFAHTSPRGALTNEAQCADLTCTAPSAGESGDFANTRMAAVLVQGDFISVPRALATKAGFSKFGKFSKRCDGAGAGAGPAPAPAACATARRGHNPSP